MEPTLLIGDRIFVSKYTYGYSKHSFPFSPNLSNKRFFSKDPVRGDLVVFKTPADNRTDYIKRLIGLPNDLIEIKDDTVYVNGNIYIEPYVYFDTRIKPLNNGSWKVKKSRYFVLGDNRNNSLDSRYDTFGTVKFSEVLGELIFKF